MKILLCILICASTSVISHTTTRGPNPAATSKISTSTTVKQDFTTQTKLTFTRSQAEKISPTANQRSTAKSTMSTNSPLVKTTANTTTPTTATNEMSTTQTVFADTTTSSTPQATLVTSFKTTRGTMATTATMKEQDTTMQTESNFTWPQETTQAPLSTTVIVFAIVAPLCVILVIVAVICFRARRMNDKGGNKLRRQPVGGNNAAFVTSPTDDGIYEGEIAHHYESVKHHYEDIDDHDYENVPTHAAHGKKRPGMIPGPATSHIANSAPDEEPRYMIPLNRPNPSYMEYQF